MRFTARFPARKDPRMRRLLGLLAAVAASGCSVFGIRTEEQPRHEILAHDGRFEIRQYAPYLTASITTAGTFKGTQRESFMTLAGYIFGKNRSSAKMEMTAPVAQSTKSESIAMAAPVMMQESGAQAWVMTFVIPSKYTLETVPKPLDPRIELRETPGELLAVARYTWSFTEQRGRRRERELRDWLDAQGKYEAVGPARFSGYDPPWTLPFLKRNEVMIPVRAKSAP
jgi:hypothetical protein